MRRRSGCFVGLAAEADGRGADGEEGGGAKREPTQQEKEDEINKLVCVGVCVCVCVLYYVVVRFHVRRCRVPVFELVLFCCFGTGAAAADVHT